MRPAGIAHRVFLPGLALLLFFTLTDRTGAQTRQVLAGSKLSPGFDMGVNSSGGNTHWLTNEGQDMKMSYPAGASWGAVFITIGKPKDPPRPSQDFAAFDTLLVEMKGESGGEQLDIGLKTSDQPDDGSETKLPLRLTSEWHTYTFPLKKFSGTDLRKLYVVAEFVFSGANPQTAYLRNVQYSNGSAIVTSPSPLVQQAVPAPARPQVSISYPPNHLVVVSPSGKRPSILVQGTDKAIPAGSKVYLIVHPMQSDNAWAQEVNISGEQWLGHAYLGGSAGLPGKGDAFEVFAAVADSLPSEFVVESQAFSDVSDIVVVTVETVSWLDRAVAYGKDLQVSGTISAFFTVLGGIIGILLERKRTRESVASKPRKG